MKKESCGDQTHRRQPWKQWNKERCLFCVRVVLECDSDENDSVSEQETVNDDDG